MTTVNILVADDDQAIAFMIERTIIAEGYGCVTVRNGREAQDALLRQNFALAILDESMPYASGSEIAFWLKSQERIKTPVIIMSGEQHAAAIGSAFSGNLIAAYLSKPFSIRTLNQLLQLFARKK